MDRLWAPWRIGYIKQSKKTNQCLFCKVAREKKDKKNLLLYRSKKAFCILNKFHYNNGHLMVSTYSHVRDLAGLTPEEITDIFSVLNKMLSLLRVTLKAEGFNVGVNVGKISGAGIPGHLHFHIVPRWGADTNFMPVIFNTKIISQSLEELYDQLHQRIRR